MKAKFERFLLIILLGGHITVFAEDSKLTDQDPKRMTHQEQFDLLRKIESRMDELNVKQLELQKFKDELETEKRGIEDKIKKMETLKAEIADKLDKKVARDMENLKEMTQIYEQMNPKTAAKVIENIDLELARVVIKLMNKKKAAEILNKITNEKAILISEYFSGFSPESKNKTMDSIGRSKALESPTNTQ